MNLEVGSLNESLTLPLRMEEKAREQIRLRIQIALIVGDLVALCIAMFVAGALRYPGWFDPASFSLLVPLSPIYFAIALNSEAYGTDVLRTPSRGIVRALFALAFSVSAVIFVAFYLKASAEMSRLVIGMASVIASLLIVASRRVIHAYTQRTAAPPLWSEIIIADAVECVGLPDLPRYDAARVGLVPTADDPLMLDRLGRFLRNVDRVVVACPPERRARWASALKGANVRGEVIAPELTDLGAVGIGRIGDVATMIVSGGALGFRNRVIKRAMDLSLSIAVIVALAPLLVLVAIAVRLDSPGPIFFIQQRLGRGNRLFGIYKFRSMRADLCDADGNQSTGRNDMRITRVGRFIRATSIDELPQLFNILRGDMSFVGPRPHALGSTAGDRLFWEVDERYWHRHAIKPGLTGLAQIRGYRGATHAASDLTNRLQADLEYLVGWTVWRDLSILLGTFKVMVHRNAF